MPLPVKIILIVLAVIVVILAVLIIVGRKMQKKQSASQADIEAASQVMSMLVIDKKMMKAKDAPLPKAVLEQIPKYMRGAKLPIVKAKIGPKVMTLIADNKIFEAIPLKAEMKAKVSGLYITEILYVRGNKFVPVKKKKSLFARLSKKAEEVKADTAKDFKNRKK